MVHIPQFFNAGSTDEGGGSLPPITADLLWQFDASTNANLYSNAGTTKVLSGGTVQQFNSSIGSRFAQQDTASERPEWYSTGGQNGKGYLEFGAVFNEWLYMAWESAFSSQNYSNYMVVEATGTNSGEVYPFYGFIGDDVSTGIGLYFRSSSNQYEMSATDWNFDFVNNSDYADNTVQIFSFRATNGGGSASLKLLVNDGTETSTDGSTTFDFGTTDPLVILGACNQSGDDVRHINMKFYEWLSYDTLHSDAERNQVMTYLNDKYNIY